MGNRNAYRKRFFEEHPFCCFCGGDMVATEIEHMPSRTMFRGKHRPKGFEFPICAECNSVSRKSEAVVALLAMARYDPLESDTSDADILRLINFVRTQCPGTAEELHKGANGNFVAEKELQRKTNTELKLIGIGPTARSHLELFSAKMGIAAYYHHAGRPLSPNGGVASRTHTFFDAINGTIPDFPDYLGKFRTIRQGEWEVSDQFSYRSAITDEGDAAIFQFLFHQNFLATTFVFESLADTTSKNVGWHPPGGLKSVRDEATNPFAKFGYSYTLRYAG